MIYKCEHGSVEYRLSIPQGLRLLGELNIVEGDVLTLDKVATIIEKIKPFIIKVDIKIGEKSFSSYEEMVEDFNCMAIFNGLIGEIFESFNVSSKKKGSLKK